MTKLDISKCELMAEGGKALAAGLKGNQVMTELNVADNRLGQNVEAARYVIDMSGVIALADVMPDMGAMSSVNVLGNSIGVEQAQELIKNLQAKDKLTTLCGFSGDETELDLSNKNLSAGCAVLVANEISDMAAMSSFTFGDKQGVTMTTAMTEANFSGKLYGNEAQMVAAFLPKCT
jgi:hypothetical protein